MNFLLIGDIVGRAGRRALRKHLEGMIEKHEIDFVVANGENAAGGFGITEKVADELFEYGIDCLTMGNHTWKNKDIYKFIDSEPRLIRPLNFPPGIPGRGVSSFLKNGRRIVVVNLIGQVFMQSHDSPFRVIDKNIKSIRMEADILLIDFHAEATGEKLALARFLDEKVDCVFGTHTHVQTNDAQILPGGAAYISDLGLSGAVDSILGMKSEEIIKKHVTGLPTKFKVGTGAVKLEGAVYRHNVNEIFPFRIKEDI